MSKKSVFTLDSRAIMLKIQDGFMQMNVHENGGFPVPPLFDFRSGTCPCQTWCLYHLIMSR